MAIEKEEDKFKKMQSDDTKKKLTKKKLTKKKSVRSPDSELIDAYTNDCISAMESIGVYSPAFLTAISSCAQLKVLRDKTYNEVTRIGVSVEEISREGEKRYRSNPLVTTYIELSKELRNTLNDLKMTVRTSSVSESDDLDELNKKLADILVGGL